MPSHPPVPLKPRCVAALLNTPIDRVYTGHKTRFSHRVKLSEIICDINLSVSYLQEKGQGREGKGRKAKGREEKGKVLVFLNLVFSCENVGSYPHLLNTEYNWHN